MNRKEMKEMINKKRKLHNNKKNKNLKTEEISQEIVLRIKLQFKKINKIRNKNSKMMMINNKIKEINKINKMTNNKTKEMINNEQMECDFLLNIIALINLSIFYLSYTIF